MKIFKKLFLRLRSSKNDDVLNMDGFRCVSVKNEFDKKFLDVITVPNNAIVVGPLCFENCEYTNQIILPKHLKKIDAMAFANCTSLSKIQIPYGLTHISDRAFDGCTSMTHIDLPNSITHIGKNCFDKCSCLSKVKLPMFADNLHNCFPAQLCYLTKEKNNYYLSDKETKNSIFVSQPYFIKYIIHHWYDNKLKKTLNILNTTPYEVVGFFHDNATYKSGDGFVDDILNANLKKYNWLSSKIINKTKFMSPFVKLCCLFGVFEKQPLKIKRISKKGNVVFDVIDYSQKGSEFLIQLINNNKLNLIIAEKINSALKNVKFNPALAEFIFKNYDELLKQGATFFAQCCDKFDVVQKAHTSNRGGCRQLAPTVEFFKSCFNKDKFNGVNASNLHTAHIIGMFYNNQDTFERADEIVKSHRQKNVPDNILEEDLNENIFNSVKNHIKNIETISKSTVSNLCDVAEKFSYEFLRKDDVLNLVLGKLCNCCAHMEGVGDGIAVSAMLHPSVQNIVIKNEEGDIVAKSTMFVNRELGYAVCNTFKVNSMLRYDKFKYIYAKFKKAISDFATEYNQKYTPKLQVVNVGMGFNDLSQFIRAYDKKSKMILNSLNYSAYSKKKYNGYQGDAYHEQYTIWPQKDISK